ncbi:MAG TPA: SpoIIE family protein phosphatase [Acidimicrobiales bacterium]|nr:SpoIIE family protein phosphatase [Acidimicrobiales bacterium]
MDLPLPDATLLLVDDRPENLDVLRLILEPLGHELVTATSGDEALKRLLTHDVSVILLDVRMPGMDGFETARHIKSRERTRDLPIIFLTAMQADSGAILEGFSSGAVDYVTKPVDAALLRAKVQVFVDLSQKTELLRRQSELLSRRLDERYAAEARHLRKLADAALAINSSLSLREMLRVITQSAREVIEAHEAETVVLSREETDTPESARAHSAKYSRWARETAVDLSPIYAFVLEQASPVRMTKKEIEASFAARGLDSIDPGHPLLEGWLAVPLVGRTGKALGIIQVADKAEGDFSDDDEVVLVQLAQLAAVAVENADRYEQQHVIADTLQRSMLPQRLPEIGGLELAARYVAGSAVAEVGGDWYDAIQLDDGRVVLAVGDVVGRGARAAAVMGQLRTAMRAYALQQLPASVLMRSLDRLLQDVSDSSLATAICLVLDPVTGRSELVVAGHPPPLLVGPDGTTAYMKCDTRPPLGVHRSPLYTPVAGSVARGSTIVMFTDGLVESRQRPLSEGLDLLSSTVGPLATSTPIEELCDVCLDRMIVASSHDDDVALLIARLT